MQGSVRRLDGKPLVFAPDGLVRGEPIRGLTDDVRVRRPRLERATTDDPSTWVSIEAQGA